MRATRPNSLVRFRHLLLGLALFAWVVAGFVLAYLRDSHVFPVATVVSISALIFIWANGAYWWVIFRYPYIELNSGQFTSRDEWRGENHEIFLRGYFLCGLIASVACISLAVQG